MNNNLIPNIKVLLSIYNQNQSDLAKLLGVSRRVVSNWMLGLSAIPLDKLRLISERYNVSLDKLMNGVVLQEKNMVSEIEEPYALQKTDTTYQDLERLLSDPNFVAHLIRALTRKHKELTSDPIYQYYIAGIIENYKKEKLNAEIREEVTKNSTSGYTKG